MANGDLVKLGTLYLGGVKQARPRRPWRSDTAPEGTSGTGDIPSYVEGQAIALRNTDTDDNYKIQWREVTIDGKKLLICDRVLLLDVSWNDLHGLGLIFGKEVTIDNQKFKLRVLTGGIESRGGLFFDGGMPKDNEWDRIITNEWNLSRLPKPVASDLDAETNAIDLNSAHNNFWNWYHVYSWCQETYAPGPSNRTVRGYDSARRFDFFSSTYRHTRVGWRPVLEFPSLNPLISGNDQDLGNKTTPFSQVYTVSDPEGNAITVKEQINGQVQRIINPARPNTNYEFAIDLVTWKSLPMNTTITMVVEATNSKEVTSKRTWTFRKTNSAPDAKIVEPKGDLANIAIVNTETPVLVWQFQDSDSGDVQSAYQIIIEDTYGNVAKDTGKTASTQSYYQVPASSLQWGTKYKWKVRVWDKFDVPSEYTPDEFFLPNRAPNVTNVKPGSANASMPAGAGTAPEFSWTFDDLDTEAQAGYQLRIYKATDDILAYNSNRINKNVSKHQVPDGVLQEGTIYYTIVTVWDPNNLSKDSEKAYFRTNATPTAPILVAPANTMRTVVKPVFEAIIGRDPENDPQHFIIQFAEDAAFTKGVLEFTSKTNRVGWQVNNGNGYVDIPTEGVNNAYEGRNVRYTMQAALAEGKTYYWRIAAIDTTTSARGTWSVIRSIRCGDRLHVELKNKIVTGSVAAKRVLIAADYTLAPGASLKVEVCNNALDVNPSWEDATATFLNMDYYTFVNKTKTAGEFAINLRFTLQANNALDEISMKGFGFSFD